jgi:pilus assembly protein FimV
LARAYIDMGDSEGARDILDEVKQEGSEEQQREAATLIDRIE